MANTAPPAIMGAMKAAVFALCLSAAPVQACELALALAVDVSGSVDPQEYEIQMRGLAEGLRDGVVSEALVRANAQVMLMQWSGSSRQRISVPWQTISTFEDVDALAQRIEDTPRAWRNFSTAIGEAMRMLEPELAANPCKHLVIDISGDGQSNEGLTPIEAQKSLRPHSVTVNALVIETSEEDLTSYFWENVIMGEGAFVVTANGFEEYPAKIRKKLQREVVVQLAELK